MKMRNDKIAKVVAVMLSTLLLGTLLTGCGESASTETEATTQETETAADQAAETTADPATEDDATEAAAPSVNLSDNLASHTGLTKMNATTIDAMAVDESIFADYDLTMINMWATWCVFCVQELPELQSVYLNLPENVNLIGICEDGATESETVLQMMEDNGITYTVLIPDDTLHEYMKNTVEGYPTTIWVDKEGNIVGEPCVGVPNGTVTEAYLKLTDEHLALVK